MLVQMKMLRQSELKELYRIDKDISKIKIERIMPTEVKIR